MDYIIQFTLAVLAGPLLSESFGQPLHCMRYLTIDLQDP